MKINSRFAKVAVASGLVVASGAAVLGITGFASAQFANESAAVVSVADDNGVVGNGTTDDSQLGTLQAEGTVSADSVDIKNGVIGETAGRPQLMAAAAEALNMTESDLIKELIAGKSIKQVADAKNVDIDTVTKAMVAAFKAHLDEEVASGEHTQAEADAKLAEFKTRLDDMVNGVRPAGGPEGRGGKGGHGGRHGHGPMGDAPAQQGTTPSAQGTSANI